MLPQCRNGLPKGPDRQDPAVGKRRLAPPQAVEGEEQDACHHIMEGVYAARCERTGAWLAMINDRVMTRWWEVDLTRVSKPPRSMPSPLFTGHQSIVHFDSNQGSVERFGIRQTIPAVHNDNGDPPSQAQYGAVTLYFVEACETRMEAGVMLSARNYADEMAKDLRFTAARRQLVSLSCAAFILSDIETRLRVRGLDARKLGSDVRPIDLPRTHAKLREFVGQMIVDVREAGSRLFD